MEQLLLCFWASSHILCVSAHICALKDQVCEQPFSFPHQGACLKLWAFMVRISSASVRIMFGMDRKANVGNSGVTIAELGQRECGMCLAHDSLLSCAVKV